MGTAIPETLLGLVECYSPSGDESRAVAYLLERMQALNFDRVSQDEVGNAIGILGQGPRQLILLGHIDTVPGEIPVRVEGQVLHGRGTVDAKGPLAAFVDAVAAVGPLPGWEIVVIGAVDEERDSVGARHLVERYNPDYAIIGEPSSWNRITLGYKGSAWADVVVTKPLAHPAGQDKNASETAVKVWLAIQAWAEELNQSRDKAFDQLLVTLKGLSSGQDGFESWAGLLVGARLPLDILPKDYYRSLADLASGAQVTPKGFPIPAYRAKKNTKLVSAFLSAIRSEGGKPAFVVKTGTADLNIVAPVWECPALAYGPGYSSLDHTPDEHISLHEYAQSVSILQAVLAKLCTGQIASL